MNSVAARERRLRLSGPNARQPTIGAVMMMIRSTACAALLGMLAATPILCLSIELARQNPDAAALGDASAEAAIAEAWPICTSMDALTEGPAWAPLDPDFAAGMKALAARDWNGAVTALRSAALRDARNADVQNYLGYAYRRLRQFEPAFMHYQQALILNPRHRSAHAHLGEAYLTADHLAKAEEHLAALQRICLIPCDEYGELKKQVEHYARFRSSN